MPNYVVLAEGAAPAFEGATPSAVPAGAFRVTADTTQAAADSVARQLRLTGVATVFAAEAGEQFDVAATVTTTVAADVKAKKPK